MGPIHGLGVDQMLEVELVGADGSYIIANANGTSVRSAGKTINNFFSITGKSLSEALIV